MIPGIEGRHAYYPPGASSPAFTLGLRKTDAGAEIWPRVRLQKPITIGSLAEAEDNADAIIGANGEVARPSFRGGKTVSYSGFIEARSLADWHTLKDAIEAGMADQSTPGKIVASWHPLSSLGPAKQFPARAMGLEIGDPLESSNCYRGTLVAAFRNHDGRYFDLLQQSVARAINVSGTDFAWPTTTLPATMQGPVNDITTNQCTNPKAAGGLTTGWAKASATHVTTLEGIPLPDGAGFFDPLFDPPATTAFHVVTNGSTVAGEGVQFSRAVVSGSAVRFVAWVCNRGGSSGSVELRIYNASDVLKQTSVAVAGPGAGWTRIETTVTPDSTGNWGFRIAQHNGGVYEYAFTQVRICPAIAVTLTPGFGPQLNLPSTWDAPDLHLDFENLSILDDAGHDYSAIISPNIGTWARNPFTAGLQSVDPARVDLAGPAIDPGVSMTLRWTPAYW